MKLLFLLLLVSQSLFAQQQQWDSFDVYPDLEVFYHPVSTKSKEAQEAFNLGLLAYYAFNNEVSYESFKKAAKADPELAMAYWGMAFALDEQMNAELKEKRALCDKAVALSKNATPGEKAYIEALAKKFADDPKTNKKVAYMEAMKKVFHDFKEDPDAGTLYAASLMDLLHWDFYKPGGIPLEETPEIVATLEEVLSKNPYHLGANHFYLHSIENSKHPERALVAAYRLDQLSDGWGHLLHSSSHIYLRLGDYEKSNRANKKAFEADEKYKKEQGEKGHYVLSALSHDLFFLLRGYLWQENYKLALETAQQFEKLFKSHVKHMPVLEYDLLTLLQVYLYFHRWNEILNVPKPSSSLHMMNCFWHYARGMAFTAKGEIEKATEEKNLFVKEETIVIQKKQMPIFEIAELLLEAQIAKANKNFNLHIELLKKAVNKQDEIDFLSWYYPVRQTLGASLIQEGHLEEAEKIFREALERLPRNGRSLFGLFASLKGQQKPTYEIERELNEALQFSDSYLTLENL